MAVQQGELLISATTAKGLHYYRSVRESILSPVSLLDYRPRYSKMLRNWSEESAIISVEPKKSAFLDHHSIRKVSVAVVFEDDFVETALVTQALKQCGVPRVYVVCSDPRHIPIYRSLGAQYAGARVPKFGKANVRPPMAG